MSLMPPSVINTLELPRFGYDVTPFGPYYQAYPDGRSLQIFADDHARSHASIAQFSKKDAETLPKWEAWLKSVGDVLGPLLTQVPPKMGSGSSAIFSIKRTPGGRSASWACEALRT